MLRHTNPIFVGYMWLNIAMAKLNISYTNPKVTHAAETVAADLNLPLVRLDKDLTHASSTANSFDLSIDYSLYFSTQGLMLISNLQDGGATVRCDFVSGANRHRVNFGGGNGQTIAKAVGVSGKFQPRVLDMTAGWGRDAFLLASLGCHLTLLKRNPIVFKLLEDGLGRAKVAAENDSKLSAIIGRMQLLKKDSLEYLDTLKETSHPDIIYIDPMFPSRKKSAKVKKDMQALHTLVGVDKDSEKMISKALTKARYRVVVKRPVHAEFLANIKPNYSLEGKSTRFDIFALQKLLS